MESDEIAARLREAIGDGGNISRHVEALAQLWADQIDVRPVFVG